MTDLDRLTETFDALGIVYEREPLTEPDDSPFDWPSSYGDAPSTARTQVTISLDHFLFDEAGSYLGCAEFGADECHSFRSRR